MAGVVTYPTLEHIAQQARPYPTHLLEGCETGLCLFAAAFNGWNDAIHFAEAGIRTTCVDVDSARLDEMQKLYPDDWTFVSSDAWAYVKTLTEPFDAISVDTFTGDVMERSLSSLGMWTLFARKVVTVTLTAGAMYRVPTGWRAWHFTRATGVYWLVLERA